MGLLLSHEQQQHVHRLGLEGCGEARQCALPAVAPQGVAIEDKKRLRAKQRQCFLDPATGLEQRLPLVRDQDLRRRHPGGQMPLKGCGLIMHIDDCRFDSKGRKMVERPVDQASPRDLDQGLRAGIA